MLKIKDGSNYITHDMTHTTSQSIEKDVLGYMEVMSLYPAILGGYATQPFLAYMTRGFPDRLTMAITAFR